MSEASEVAGEVASEVAGDVAGERVAAARRAVGLIDLTDLSDDHAPDGIDELCRRAREHAVAAVCVWPEFVATCARLLDDSGVRVATVVNFPSGDEPEPQVLAATRKALDAGADDIDLVLPYRAFLVGDNTTAGAMVASIASVIDGSRILKVILETGELGEANVAGAARLAIDHGADFVKTSTGKTPVGATPEAVRLMAEVVAETATRGRTVGLKPSGGIRTVDDAMTYIEIAESVLGAGWATPSTFRFGASGLLDALLAVISGEAEPTASSY